MRRFILFVSFCVLAILSFSALEIEQLDPAMAAKPADDAKVTWHLPFEAPIRIFGFPWLEVDGKYARLPIQGRPEQVTQYGNDGTPVMVESSKCGALILSSSTAGGQIRFRTDSSQFAIHAEVASATCMYHMTFIGKAGFDIYVKNGAQWQCVGLTRISVGQQDYTANMASGLKREMRDVIINFPLYTGVKTLAIGLDKDAKIEAPTPFHDNRPIVFYGTSITQGGCATRPGMASSNILSRMLDREFINEGFSGNGKGEPEIAEMLADIQNTALYILDYMPNVTLGEYCASLPKFIDVLRAKHPETPILLLSATPMNSCLDAFATPYDRYAKQRDFAKQEWQRRREAGDQKIFFLDIYDIWMQRDFWESEVDGCHLTDLGFLQFSKDVAPVIRGILGE